eukprot:950328_1
MADEGILPDASEMEWFVWFMIAAIFMIILTMIHAYNVVLDFFTEERKSLAYRTKKPKLSKSYKFAQYLTLFVLSLYALSSFMYALEMGSYSWSLQDCINLNNAGGWFLLPGKGFMYLLFMYRLHICYQKSAYGYSKRLLLTIGWANVAFGFIFEGITTYLSQKYWLYFADTDGFPNPCFPIPGVDWKIQYFGTTMMVWDFSMNVLSLGLFIKPLYKAMKFRDVDGQKVESSMTKNMIRIAIKYTLLSSFASISTSVFWAWTTWWSATYYVVAFDVVVNSVCVMLMTAYYRDEWYYERLCWCILCCPCCKYRLKQLKIEREMTKGSTTYTATSPASKKSIETAQTDV